MGPEALEEAMRWIEQAKAELEDARALAERGRYYLSLYLCQQSAEKALKGFLYLKEEEPLLTHSVAKLLRMSSSIDEDFEAVSGAKRLDDYYVPTRYPNGLPGEVPASYYDDRDEAEEALRSASAVIELVGRKIPPN